MGTKGRVKNARGSGGVGGKNWGAAEWRHSEDKFRWVLFIHRSPIVDLPPR